MEDRKQPGSVSQSWSQLPEYCPDFDDLLEKNQDKLQKIHDLFRDIGEAQIQFSVKVLGRQKRTIFDKCGIIYMRISGYFKGLWKNIRGFMHFK